MDWHNRREQVGAMLMAEGPNLQRYIETRFPRKYRTFSSPEDIYQETCMAAWQHIDHLRLDGGQRVRGWLRSIAENKIIDIVRRAKAQKRRNPINSAVFTLSRVWTQLVSSRRTPSGDAAFRELETRLPEALDLLLDRERCVVAGRFLGGKSVNEIADQLGLSCRAAWCILYRAMRKLRALCGPVLGDAQ